MKRLRFTLVAMLLSAAWFPILLLLPMHGGFIRSNLYPGGAMLSPIELVFLLVAAGLAVAWIFRRLIISADTPKSLILGCTLPYVSAFLFLTLLGVYVSLITGRPIQWFGVVYWGMLHTFYWLPVVASLGILMQFALRWAGGSSKRNGAPNATGHA